DAAERLGTEILAIDDDGGADVEAQLCVERACGSTVPEDLAGVCRELDLVRELGRRAEDASTAAVRALAGFHSKGAEIIAEAATVTRLRAAAERLGGENRQCHA